MTQTSISQSNPSSNHNPDLPSRTDYGTSPETGRGPGGRFCKGNTGGPGNPYARQVAALRQEFFAAATKEDIAAIARALIEKAKQGDVAAARLVLQYTLGRPAEAVDPDRLDEMEWQQWQRETAGEEILPLFGKMHVSTANTLVRTVVPALQKEHLAELKQQMDERDERRREEAAEAQREAERRAARQGRWAEQQTEPGASPPVATRKVPAPAPGSPAQVETAKAGETTARMSPVEAQMTEQGGQGASPEGCAAAADRVLRMLDATVTKRGETERRAANDFVDG
jgi:hypothetical protein